jgi:hypothetical protein
MRVIPSFFRRFPRRVSVGECAGTLGLSRIFGYGTSVEDMNKKSELVTHIFDRVGLHRFSRGGSPSTARGDLFIDPHDPYRSKPFCFSAARRQSCVRENLATLRRAAEKQKGGCYSRIVSINRSPLTGFGHSKAAQGGIKSRPFLSVFLYTFRDACEVQSRAALLPSNATTLSQVFNVWPGN